MVEVYRILEAVGQHAQTLTRSRARVHTIVYPTLLRSSTVSKYTVTPIRHRHVFRVLLS